MMVKICGITNAEDALAAVDGGAAALGFNFWPKSARYIAPEKATELMRKLPAGVLRVGVFVDEKPEAVKALARDVGLDVAQLHGHESAADFPDGMRVWKAVRIGAGFDRSALSGYAAEALLLDGMANGTQFEWKLAAGVPGKVIVAGGLDAGNVAEAIREARPWGVDACSRLESSPGKKDHLKMAQFLKAALSA